MTQLIQIQSGVPLPNKTYIRWKEVLPLDKMEIGECFAIPEVEGREPHNVEVCVRDAVKRHERDSEQRFVFARKEGRMHVWKIR